MPALNFTLRDILGVLLALFCFPSLIMFPGYVIGWMTDLFNFKRRNILSRHMIAILVSIAVVPILFYWVAFFVSFLVVKLVMLIIFILYTLIVILEIMRSKRGWVLLSSDHFFKIVFFIIIGWIFLSVLLLVDLPWGTSLYNNIISLDLATRATLVNAITRSGIPPINPSYFSGQPVYITSLYYFWYILCSAIQQIGGGIVDARMALIAGDIWCGLALMALIAFYLKVRNQVTGEAAWRLALGGIGLLAISGLDIIPASIIMLGSRLSVGFMWPHGDIEHWNEQITAWVGSLFWVPHHVAAIIACTTAFLLFQYYKDGLQGKKMIIIVVAGLAFASAFGLSAWVTIVYAVFLWGWSITLLVWHRDRKMFWLLLLTGVIALLFASPFLFGIIKGGTDGIGKPFAFEVRRFIPALPFIGAFSPFTQNVINILLLPLNYLLELGFFFVVGILWLQQYRQGRMQSNRFVIPEILLLGVVTFVCTFFRSNIVGTNDLGWRGWLLGQFVLLIWAVDLNRTFLFLPNIGNFIKTNLISERNNIQKLMAYMLLIGVLTSIMDVALLRMWPILVDVNVAGFPNTLSPDTHLGQRTFAGRMTYEFINNNLPNDIVIQQNPVSDVDRIDRVSGLYANRQFAISYNAPFNIPLEVLRLRSKEISAIFALENQTSWGNLDMLCKKYFIDVLVVTDQDPLWENLPMLYQKRSALYKNRFYAVLPCGSFGTP